MNTYNLSISDPSKIRLETPELVVLSNTNENNFDGRPIMISNSLNFLTPLVLLLFQVFLFDCQYFLCYKKNS